MVDVVQNLGCFGMVDKFVDFFIKFGDDDVVNFGVVLDKEFVDEEFGIFVFSKLCIGILKFFCDLFFLDWG